MNLIINFPCFLMESLAHQGCIYFKNTVILGNIIAISNIGFLF